MPFNPLAQARMPKPLELLCEFQVREALPKIALRRIEAYRPSHFSERRFGIEEIESAGSDLEAIPRRLLPGQLPKIQRQLDINDRLRVDSPAITSSDEINIVKGGDIPQGGGEADSSEIPAEGANTTPSRDCTLRVGHADAIDTWPGYEVRSREVVHPCCRELRLERADACIEGHRGAQIHAARANGSVIETRHVDCLQGTRDSRCSVGCRRRSSDNSFWEETLSREESLGRRDRYGLVN